jgi:hypothetical protein
MWVPSAATAVPSPQARDMSSRAWALTTSVIAWFSLAMEKCRFAVAESLCPLTPLMCRAAS